MAAQGHGGQSDWHLGAEPIPLRQTAALPAERYLPPNRSHERLERPLVVVTTERLGWILVIAYAAAVRLLMLGGRPLDAAEASRSTAAFDLAMRLFPAHGHAPLALSLRDGWIGLLDASVIHIFGADDFVARIVFAIAGLAIVALVFAMRSRLGRAGALAAAAILALSPNLTWFSRYAAFEVPALLALFATIVMFLETIRRPRIGRAIALGVLGGLTLAAGSAMVADAAIFAVAMAIIGGWLAITTAHPWINIRVWWRRRSAVALVAAGCAIALWLACITALFTIPVPTAIAGLIRPLIFPPTASSSSLLMTYIPAAYEFLVVLAALAGLVIVAAWRVRSSFAAFVAIWTVGITAFTILSPMHALAGITEIILPMALLAGIGVDWLHRSRGWIVVRYPIAAIGLITVWIQILTNFAYPAPNPVEPISARHATLFWIAPATTVGLPNQFAGIVAGIGDAPATVYYAVDSPLTRWYLRALARVASPAEAGVIVGSDTPPPQWTPGPPPIRVTLELSERLVIASDITSPGKLVAKLWRTILTTRLPAHPTAPAPAALLADNVELLIRSPGLGASTEIIAPPPGVAVSSPAATNVASPGSSKTSAAKSGASLK